MQQAGGDGGLADIGIGTGDEEGQTHFRVLAQQAVDDLIGGRQPAARR